MTQENLRELARQGDPQAIASAINRTLKPKGINAEVTREGGILHLTLESDRVPSQTALVDFIRKGMTNLGVETIYTVKVYGRQAGVASPAWEEDIELMPAPMLNVEDDMMHETPMPEVENEAGGEHYEPEEEYEPQDEGEMDEDEELEEDEDEATPPPKKSIPKVLLLLPLLLVLLAGGAAALYFTGNLPFLTAADPAPSPSPPAPSPKPKGSPVTSPSPKATTSPRPASPSPTPSPKPTVSPQADPWRQAVNLAQSAANRAQTAYSRAEWDAVASDWEKAAELMRAVPESSPNYQTAQQKAVEYQGNFEVARQRGDLAQ